MKQYFAKYLPVEGKIIDEEMVMFKIDDTWTEPCSFDSYLGSNIQEVKQGKLFLCSEDIKLNDTYYHDSFCPYPDGEIADTNTKVMNAHMMITNEGPDYEGDTSFKVIGEISSDALSFVKEGDKFDEDEISIVKFPKRNG
jgi:hypothetical protein